MKGVMSVERAAWTQKAARCRWSEVTRMVSSGIGSGGTVESEELASWVELDLERESATRLARVKVEWRERNCSTVG